MNDPSIGRPNGRGNRSVSLSVLALLLVASSLTGSARAAGPHLQDPAGDANATDRWVEYAKYYGVPEDVNVPPTAPASVPEADLVSGTFETLYTGTTKKVATHLRFSFTTTASISPPPLPGLAFRLIVKSNRCGRIEVNVYMSRPAGYQFEPSPPRTVLSWGECPEPRPFGGNVTVPISISGNKTTLTIPLSVDGGHVLRAGDRLSRRDGARYGTNVMMSGTDVPQHELDRIMDMTTFVIGSDIPK